MKGRLQPFSMGSSSYILAKGLLPSMAEKFRTHGWSLLLKHSVPFSSMTDTLKSIDDVEKRDQPLKHMFSSMGNTPKLVDDEEKRGSPLKPIFSNNNLHILPLLKAQNISSKELLPSMAETFRTHDWPLLLKHSAPLSSTGNTLDFVDDEEISGGRHLKPISFSDKDLQLPSFLEQGCFPTMMGVPSMAETFTKKDWSLLRKFSSMDSKLNIEDAFKSELAAICVWFLFTEVPPNVKEEAARTLAFISLGTSKVTKMSIDQTGVENLVVRILSSGNTEAQRQVCLALSVLADYRLLTVTRSAGLAGILDQLLQLVCNLNCNPDSSYPVLNALAHVSLVGKGMRVKIVETELLHSWLVKFLSRKDDESILADVWLMVAYIAHGGQCDFELWDHIKEQILPPIIDGLSYRTCNYHLLKVVACAMFKITKYGSSDQINDVVEIGGLKMLLSGCSFKDRVDDEDEEVVGECLKAIANIMRAGEAKAENVYAKMINGYSQGWDVLHQNVCRTSVPSIRDMALDLLDYYPRT